MHCNALVRFQGPVVCVAVMCLAGCGQAPPAAPGGQAPQGAQKTPGQAPAGKSVATKVNAPHLPNAYRLHEKVISGGLPEGDEAFAELKELGIKTVISVDGAKPDLAMAKKYGMRYVHLPHSYDGIPEKRGYELGKAVRDLPGPIYIQCHHGKHRSPAASTVACVTAGMIKPEDALGVLKTAGTSENYRGLYQSATSAKRLDEKVLDALEADFPETAKLPAMAEAMVAIEHVHDRLKAFSAGSWQPLAKYPDVDPAHEALLLREHFTELLRTPEVAREPERYREMMRESEKAGVQLEEALRATPADKRGASQAIKDSFATINKNCAACHKEYRDVPLGEKKGR
jgi:hypothetical protein